MTATRTATVPCTVCGQPTRRDDSVCHRHDHVRVLNRDSVARTEQTAVTLSLTVTSDGAIERTDYPGWPLDANVQMVAEATNKALPANRAITEVELLPDLHGAGIEGRTALAAYGRQLSQLLGARLNTVSAPASAPPRLSGPHGVAGGENTARITLMWSGNAVKVARTSERSEDLSDDALAALAERQRAYWAGRGKVISAVCALHRSDANADFRRALDRAVATVAQTLGASVGAPKSWTPRR